MTDIINYKTKNEILEEISENCPICMNSLFVSSFNPIKITKCGHKFHKKCLYTSCLSRGGVLPENVSSENSCRCPICRGSFKFLKDINYLGTSNIIKGFLKLMVDDNFKISNLEKNTIIELLDNNKDESDNNENDNNTPIAINNNNNLLDEHEDLPDVFTFNNITLTPDDNDPRILELENLYNSTNQNLYNHNIRRRRPSNRPQPILSNLIRNPRDPAPTRPPRPPPGQQPAYLTFTIENFAKRILARHSEDISMIQTHNLYQNNLDAINENAVAWLNNNISNFTSIDREEYNNYKQESPYGDQLNNIPERQSTNRRRPGRGRGRGRGSRSERVRTDTDTHRGGKNKTKKNYN